MRTHGEIGNWLVKYLDKNGNPSRSMSHYIDLHLENIPFKLFKYRLAQDMRYINEVDDERLTERDKADVKSLWEFIIGGEK